ncbi:MAG: hypothetical protein RI580_02265 [Halothece sp. Uz-M2-17]|nr:hypothetical protein [Halothece sp. Uz-M2-17]
MSQFSQKSKRQKTANNKKPSLINPSAILALIFGLFTIVYLFDLTIQSYFAPPPEYSEEYQETYRKIGEQDPTKP